MDNRRTKKCNANQQSSQTHTKYPPEIRNAPYLFTCYPSPYPELGGGSTYHAVIRRRFTKSEHCAGLRLSKTLGCSIPPGCAFASLAAPAAHRQHHLHHPHQRLPRMRMMQVMLGMLPMLVSPPPPQFLVEIIYFPLFLLRPFPTPSSSPFSSQRSFPPFPP